MLFVFLLFVICAYMVLIRDIWTPIVLLAAQALILTTSGSRTPASASEADREDSLGDVVLLFVIIIISPFLLKKDLHSLRYNCYLGFASIALLCLAIAYRASQKIAAGDIDIKMWPDSLTDVLFAYPIPILALMCHFNMIGVQGSLIDPTRARVRRVIDGSMLISGAITYALGFFGYIWGGSSTQGNILLNFDFDKVILVGRVGCGITIMLASAMITLPCREAMLSLGTFYSEWRASTGGENNERIIVSSSTYGAVNTGTDEEEMPLSPKETGAAENNGGIPPDNRNRILHFSSTFFIVAVCYIGAIAAPGVATVWSICGCMMSFIIAFILPALLYIKIRVAKKGHLDARVFSSWLLFAISVIGAVMCTAQTIWRLFIL